MTLWLLIIWFHGIDPGFNPGPSPHEITVVVGPEEAAVKLWTANQAGIMNTVGELWQIDLPKGTVTRKEIPTVEFRRLEKGA